MYCLICCFTHELLPTLIRMWHACMCVCVCTFTATRTELVITDLTGEVFTTFSYQDVQLSPVYNKTLSCFVILPQNQVNNSVYS